MDEKKARVALCFSNPVDQDLLFRFVAELGYDPVSGLDEAAGCDLVFLDAVAARGLASQAAQWKKDSRWFLPVIVGVKAGADPVPWLAAGFDDVLRLPCAKGELKARLSILLRLRHQSKELGRRSEYLHRALIESSGDHIFVLDANGRYVSSNNRVAHFNLTLGEELVGKSLEDVFPPEVASFYRQQLEVVLTTGKTAAFEHDLPSPAGIHYHLDTLYSIRSVGGERLVGGICRDITDRKRAEQELRESEERFSLAFYSSPDSININRLSDGLYVEINEGFTEITGYTWADVAGKTSAEIRVWADMADRQRLVNALKEHGRVSNMQFQFRMKDGTLRIGLMSAAVISLHGKAHILSITRDIEELKQAEQALRKSEKRFRGVIENTGTAMLIVNQDSSIAYANEECLDTTGYAHEELVGRKWSEFVHPDELPRMEEHFRLRFVAPDLAPKRYETRLVNKAGETRNALLTIDAVPETGQIVVSLLDITDRVRAEEARRLLETAIHRLVEGVFICDWDNRILYANPALTTITGFGPDEILGKTPGMFKSGRHEPAFYQDLKETIYGGRPWQGYLTNRKKDGSSCEVFASIVPILDQQGEITHFVSVHRDMTRERETEQRLCQNQRLEAIGTLAGGIAHDFNNILSPIMGYAELCQDALPPGSAVRDDLDQVMLAARRARDLVRQILSFSRQSKHERAPLTIGPVIKEALKLLRSSIPATIDIHQDIGSLEETVVADPTEIHQVVMNLCTNAFHAMPEGGTLSVSLKAMDIDRKMAAILPGIKPGRFLKLVVSDTGCGIAPEIIDKIFEPYFTTKIEGRGTGLGLATSHGIVTSCGGAMTVYSEVGHGSTFNVYLPVSTTAVKEVAVTRPEVPGGHERILYVDDDPSIADLGKRTLERYGYQVTTHTDPVGALNLVKEDTSAFDLVVTDMTMPGMTGEELARSLLDLRPGLPVILCTGFSERMNAEKAQKMGIGKFLNKPVPPAELAEAVRRLLDESSSNKINE